MDAGKASDYKAVKAMLLREFKLSPAVYIEKFNTDTGKQDETCLMYSARLDLSLFWMHTWTAEKWIAIMIRLLSYLYAIE